MSSLIDLIVVEEDTSTKLESRLCRIMNEAKANNQDLKFHYVQPVLDDENGEIWSTLVEIHKGHSLES